MKTLSKNQIVIKIYLILIFLFFSVSLFSQKDNVPINYYQIKTDVYYLNSQYYYPKLFVKYENNDTTLTIQDYRHLYYGYIFQANYSPNPGSVYQQNLLVYLKKAKLSESDLKQMIKYSNLILKELPFDLKTLHILAYCYNELGDLENNHLIDYKRIMIIEAIFSSGDGLSEKTAWHVISNAHEYDIINELGYRYGGQQTIGLCDYVLVAQNSDKIEGFYFRMSNFIGD